MSEEIDTRERILLAARRIFAERGFDASLREITEAARANTAAVNYYFRSKDELIRSVLELSLAPIIKARLGALDACEDRGGAVPSLESLVEALVRPLVELSSGEYRDAMLLLMHVRTLPQRTANDIVVEQFRPVHSRFIGLLERVLPDLGMAELALRYDCARGATLQILVDLAPATHLVTPPEAWANKETLVRQLCQFVRAGFEAPPTAGIAISR